jgi:hypothetical protein
MNKAQALLNAAKAVAALYHKSLPLPLPQAKA